MLRPPPARALALTWRAARGRSHAPPSRLTQPAGPRGGPIGHAFAELHRLQAADLRALVAIMSAEGNGTPLTAGQRRDQGRATGQAFFGSLGDRAHAILDGFTEDELHVITRFITAHLLGDHLSGMM